MELHQYHQLRGAENDRFDFQKYENMDKNLSELLRWGIENSSKPIANGKPDGQTDNGITTAVAAMPGAPSDSQPSSATTSRTLQPEVLNALFGGPSDADLMKASMAVITSTADTPENTLENKLVAFDNFEQLVESLDNANLMQSLGLWPPLLDILATSSECELRRMAAWCIGTAVQNNETSQLHLLAVDGGRALPLLVQAAARTGEIPSVRRKAVYALSSVCRNFQPAIDAVLKELANLENKSAALAVAVAALPRTVDARDMEAVDGVMGILKDDIASAQE